MEAIERWQIEIFDAGTAVDEIREGTRQARREEDLLNFVVGELTTGTEAVALTLLNAEIYFTLV